MTRMVKQLMVGAYVVLAGVVLAFGTVQATAGGDPCDDLDNQRLGSCPPYDDDLCARDCEFVYGSGATGQCVSIPGVGTCCQCQT